MKMYEYIVVGSGCSAAMAAQTLVDAKREVMMLDVGVTDKTYKVPDEDFLTLRKTDTQQYKYLIGDNLEGINWGSIGKGAQLTPPRNHMTKFVEQFESVKSSTFSPVESLGYGGLGIGWGIQCWEYSDADLKATGLNVNKMRTAYTLVSDRIGVSATRDDAAVYTLNNLNNFQPSARMDENHSRIYKAYLKHKEFIQSKGFFVGRTPLALITANKDGRKAYEYKDMDFYSDNGKSAWRPWIAVDALKTRQNFQYVGGYLVTRFAEKGDHTEVHAISVTNNTKKVFYCQKLILATGALSTGRIALRSQGTGNETLPVLCNPYTYIPCLQPSMFGKAAQKNKLGFAQLSFFQDTKGNDKDISIASTYSYQSLMLFRIILQLPFNFVDARMVMRYLMSGLVIMGVHHPDSASSHKNMRLVENADSPTGDVLEINYELDSATKKRNKQREKEFVRIMRNMNVFAIKRINPGYGSSIHYAGTLPFSDKAKSLSLDSSGRLHGTTSVFVADSSGFRYLPARGLTFSLMANAHLVAERSLRG